MTADSKIIRFVPVSLNTFYVITSVLISFMAVFPFHYSVSLFFSLLFPFSFITVSVFFRYSVFVYCCLLFYYCFRFLSSICFRFLSLPRSRFLSLLFPFSRITVSVSLPHFKFSRLCFQFSLIPLLPFSLVSRGRSCPVYTARDGHFIARFNCKSIKMCLLLLQNPLSWCIHVHLSFFYAVFLRFIYFYCYCPNSLIFSASIIRIIVDIRYIASRSIIKR